MQLIVPKEIREITAKIRPWLLYSDKFDGPILKEDAPEEIKKLKKKRDDWWEKNTITFD